MMFVRFLMITTGLLLLLTAGGVLAATPYWESMVRDALAGRLGAALHADASLGGVSVDVQQKALVLKDLVIRNPPAFEPGEALRAGRILLVVNPLTLFSEAPTVTTIRLEELTVGLSKTTDTGTNLNTLAAACLPKDGGLAGDPATPGLRVGRIECTGVTFVLLGNPPTAQKPPAPLPAFTIEDLGGRGALRIQEVAGTFLQTLVRGAEPLQALTPAA